MILNGVKECGNVSVIGAGIEIDNQRSINAVFCGIDRTNGCPTAAIR